MKFETFQLLSSAFRLARFSHVWLVNKREPEWKPECTSKSHAKAWVYDWNPCHEALKDQIKKDLNDKLKEQLGRHIIFSLIGVMVLERNNSIATPTGRMSIIIPIGDAIGGYVTFYDGETGKDAEWDARKGYIMGAGTSIQALQNDITFFIIGVRENTSGQDIAEGTMES